MNYQSSSRSQKKRSPTSSNTASSSRQATPTPTLPPSLRYFTAVASSSVPYESPYAQNQDRLPQRPSDSSVFSTSSSTSSYATTSGHSTTRKSQSKQSSSGSDDSFYDSPGPHSSRYTTPAGTMSSSQRTMSSNDREQLIRSLRTHRVNTLSELRRIEKLFASNESADVTEAMTTAWAHYVNSNNLLSELRGMTKNYPFSSECLDEAKWQVIGDPSSTRSWNYCWLILTKIKNENLIRKHSRLLAAKPTMWGGRTPSPSGVDKLSTACEQEWTRALTQMLRQWSTPPSKSGK